MCYQVKQASILSSYLRIAVLTPVKNLRYLHIRNTIRETTGSSDVNEKADPVTGSFGPQLPAMKIDDFF